MSNSAFDTGIPILTEIIQASGVEHAAQPAAHQAASPQASERFDAAGATDVDGWLNEEWDRLERKIGGRILRHVMQRLEADIENRVSEALSDVLQAAIEGMANNLKQDLQYKLQDVIFQAVKEEISGMQRRS